jgi:hypothetical protein
LGKNNKWGTCQKGPVREVSCKRGKPTVKNNFKTQMPFFCSVRNVFTVDNFCKIYCFSIRNKPKPSFIILAFVLSKPKLDVGCECNLEKKTKKGKKNYLKVYLPFTCPLTMLKIKTVWNLLSTKKHKQKILWFVLFAIKITKVFSK